MSTRKEMAAAINAMLGGTMGSADAIDFLSVMDETAYTAEELAGACEGVMKRMQPFPAFPDAVDCCGTGGDGQHSYNISTAAALVVAACGVTVAKHGNRAITSKSGSADVLEALGVKTDLTPAQCEQVLREVGICFLFAPTFHPGFARIAPLRKQIGRRTIFNILGPLCNPAHVECQLIGVYHRALCMPVAGAAKLLGKKHVMVVHGHDGADEISAITPTYVCELKNGQLREYEIDAADTGLQVADADSLKGGDATVNADALKAVLDGTGNAYARATILNAAAVLYIAGKVDELAEGALMAANALASGATKRKLEQLIEASNKA
jgi:anthranilate phosphoribosyltransferase